tara:strand:- start:1036 stop:1248 length:213 start_codon:yes stop_codon:yes gene_type:complete
MTLLDIFASNRLFEANLLDSCSFPEKRPGLYLPGNVKPSGSLPLKQDILIEQKSRKVGLEEQNTGDDTND